MKLVSPSSLEGAEKLVYDNLAPWLPPGGVCVNVILSPEPWDIRPLVLLNGKVYLYRFTRPLRETALENLASEMQGFSVIPGWNVSIERKVGFERLVVVRPYVTATLQDRMQGTEELSTAKRWEIARALIETVKMLKRRNLVHGHISPANIADSSGALVLLDPRLGALHYSKDVHLAPEIVAGGEPPDSSDLFGLGSVLRVLLGDEVSHQQREVIDRLLLPSPRQRPSIEEVEREFLTTAISPSVDSVRPGKVLRRGESLSGSTRGEPRSEQAVAVDSLPVPPPHRSHAFPFIIALSILAAVLALRVAAPERFEALLGAIPFVTPHENPEYVLAWGSNDKARMRSVGRLAVLGHNASAEAVILNDILSGENRPGVNGTFLRVALNPLWDDALSSADRTTAVAIALTQIVPEGLAGLPPIESLHPGVILAIAGQSRAKDPSPELLKIPIEKLVGLPDPFGKIFAQLKSAGSASVGDPEVIGLASIIANNPSADNLEAFLGPEGDLKQLLARIEIALPVLSANESIAKQLLASARDRGADIGQLLSWFDIDELGLWSKVQSSDKFRIVLGEAPQKDLRPEHLCDLLAFPLPAVREHAEKVLRATVLKGEGAQLFMVLSGEQNRLTRAQTIALLSALQLDSQKQAPFVSAFFSELKPPVDEILLVLLARSDKPSTDIFNLQAASYLRRSSSWAANADLLKMLASHPEPLARSLAYARLSPSDPGQRRILQDRVSLESDPPLLKSITEKLSSSIHTPPAAP